MIAFKAPYRILVVEDSIELRLLLVRVFTDAGFQVAAACSAAGATAILANSPQDIVITDCFLPDASDSFVKTIKLRYPNMPVIAVSGDPDAARRMLPDADEILGRPVSLAELVQTIFKFVEAIEAERFYGERPN